LQHNQFFNVGPCVELIILMMLIPWAAPNLRLINAQSQSVSEPAPDEIVRTSKGGIEKVVRPRGWSLPDLKGAEMIERMQEWRSLRCCRALNHSHLLMAAALYASTIGLLPASA
jgi:hypothetical protein